MAICTSAAHVSRAEPLTAIARRYGQMLNEPVSLEANQLEPFIEYLTKRSLLLVYGPDRTPVNVGSVTQRLTARPNVSVQDRFLSDPALVTRFGRERDVSLLGTVGVCVELGLIRGETGTIQAYGTLLLEVWRDLGHTDVLTRSVTNPFARNPELAMVLYRRIANEDYLFQREIVGYISEHQEFSFQELVVAAPGLLRRVADGPKTVANRQQRVWLDRQIAFADRANGASSSRASLAFGRRARLPKGRDRTKAPSDQSLLRPLEDMFIPRLEFLVDMGAITKVDRDGLVYRAGPAFGALKELFSRPPNGIELSFFRIVSQLWSKTVTHVTEQDEILARLTPPYRRLRNTSGYAPISDCVILANTLARNPETATIIEVPEATQALLNLSRGDGSHVLINNDRYRKPFTFRIEA